jgi:periplasmic protein CpxP/Spy
MSQAIDRAVRAAAVPALAGALIVLLLGLPGSAAAGADPGQFRLAQAKSAPQRPAGKAPEAAPAQGGGIDAQIADLQKKLRITPAQQPQFDAFAQVMRQNAQQMDAVMGQQGQNRTRNAVEDLRASAQLAEAEVEGMKRLLPVLQALYDGLADQQKRLADSIMVQPGPDAEPQKAPPKR